MKFHTHTKKNLPKEIGVEMVREKKMEERLEGNGERKVTRERDRTHVLLDDWYSIKSIHKHQVLNRPTQHAYLTLTDEFCSTFGLFAHFVFIPFNDP